MLFGWIQTCVTKAFLASATVLFPALVFGVTANYELKTTTLDSGGGQGRGGVYGIDASVGGVSGDGTSKTVEVKHGYEGQLYEVMKVQVSFALPEINESAAAVFTAQTILDDGTLLSLAPSDFSWRVLSGPTTVISNGVVMIPTVYANTSLAVEASYQGFVGQVTISVLNTNFDDFGKLGGDGLPDDWQISFFKSDTLAAAPTADPDRDGLDNAHEFAAGTDPTRADSDFDGVSDGKDADPVFAPAVERASTVYTVKPEVLDGGGGYFSAAPYSMVATLAFAGGAGTVQSWQVEHGFAPMIGLPDPLLFHPELQLLVTDTPDPVRVGESLTYRIEVVNRGNWAATELIVSNSLAAGVLFGSASSPDGTWTGSGPVTGRLDVLPAGVSWLSTLVVTPQKAGVITNRVTVQAAEMDTNEADNAAIQVTTVLSAPAQRELRLSEVLVADERFSMQIEGFAGESIRIDESTDLSRWSPVVTNDFARSSSFTFFDDTRRAQRRFFRAVILP